MLPNPPPRRPGIGFLYVPPYRVQGISIAGEQSVVQVPELDVCFDIGLSPRIALASDYIGLTHGHMDHAAALSYYFSQRRFQGMGVGTVVCHPAMEEPIHELMSAWIKIEAQRTPYNVVALEPDQELEIKNRIFLRAFKTVHTVPSIGFVVVEKRSKLREQYSGLPQEKLVELKKAGEDITETRDVPLICYTGDTAWGDHFSREDVLGAKVLITECTFLERGHRSRANVGKHLHVDHLVHLVKRSNAEAVVLTHLSRRTHMKVAKEALDQMIPAEHRNRVLILMDHRANRDRYDRQREQAEAEEAERLAAS